MIVEADGEVVEVSVEVLSVHIHAKVIAVGVDTVGEGPVASQASQIDIEVKRAFFAQSIVQTGDDAETDGGEVVTIVGGVVSHGVEVVGFQMETEANLSFAEQGEVTPVQEVVTEVRIDVDDRAPTGGVVILAAKRIDVSSVVVVNETELDTELHFVIQLITDFRHDGDIGGGVADTTSIIIVMSAVVTKSDLATEDELCICSHSESDECEGHKDFFHNR